MIISNGARLRSNPMRHMSVNSVLNDVCFDMVLPGSLLNQSTSFGSLASVPAGYYLGSAWIAPRGKGAISSRNSGSISVNASGQGAEGINISGPSSMSFDASGFGKMVFHAVAHTNISIVSTSNITGIYELGGSIVITMTSIAVPTGKAIGGGSSSMDFSSLGSIVAVFNSSGSSYISITSEGTAAAIARLSATANISITSVAEVVAALSSSGHSSFSVLTNGSMNGIGKATAHADLSFHSNMISYARGFMVGTTENNAGPAVSALTQAEHDKLMEIISDPSLSKVEGDVSMKQAIEIILAVMVGKTSGVGNQIVFRDTLDTTNRVVATVDDSGNRLAVELHT